MMILDDAIRDVRKLALDTAPVIYFVEANPRYDAVVTQVFQRIADGYLRGVTSVITLTEVLVHPIRNNRSDLQAQYGTLLTGSRNVDTVVLHARTAKLAAELRARYALRTPDAIQIATALSAGCEAFLTNDLQLQRVQELRVLVLTELTL